MVAGALASAGKENAAPSASAETAELAAQLREARMENDLLQAELNSVADTAKTLKKQLECVQLPACPSCASACLGLAAVETASCTMLPFLVGSTTLVRTLS
jgi:hypothetical protein